MEEEKNRRNKRNKKKKNKQTAKPTESVTLDARETTSDSQGNVTDRGEDNNRQVSGATDELNGVGGDMSADKDATLSNCFEGENLAKAEEHCRLDRETNFLEKIKELQTEKDAHTKKEAFLAEKIKQLQNEKYESSQKEASLKEKLVQLEKEKNALIEKVANFEEKIKHMDEEAAAVKLREFNSQEKFKQMEKERDSWILKENSAKESIANLSNEKAQLQAQVLELVQARETLSEEKRQLKELNSSLRLQITNLESSAGLLHSSMDNKAASEEEMNYKTDAAEALVEKLIAESSELTVKVNELYAEHDQRGLRRTEYVSSAGFAHGALNAPPGDGSTFMPESAVGNDARHKTAQATDSISEASKMMSISGSSQSLEDVMGEDKRNGELVKSDGYGIGMTTSEIMERDEIVQIPLDESEVATETNSELTENDENTDDVPLTDAPLIGAPFRLISFVARYVSGADLVNKNAGTSV